MCVPVVGVTDVVSTGKAGIVELGAVDVVRVLAAFLSILAGAIAAAGASVRAGSHPFHGTSAIQREADQAGTSSLILVGCANSGK